jgi:hypothetical protein
MTAGTRGGRGGESLQMTREMDSISTRKRWVLTAGMARRRCFMVHWQQMFLTSFGE